ncbi:MAG: class I SAM-dependent methyltransferase [Acidobacteria bacterium]|nr:class I SAM-dependent methyltransferase [Acidobacteriota bacterium]
MDNCWHPYLQRYRNGEWRARIWRDMIVADVKRLERENGKLRVLDIGCGGGFDNDAKLQQSLSAVSLEYIGIEPDESIELGDIFTSEYRCPFECAPIEDGSIDIAFSVMVLEHFEEPRVFWDKIYNILKKNGIFWGFTVDARHWFVYASLLLEKLHIKDWYLNRLHGTRGEKRYENYRTFYRSNTPKQIKRLTHSFSSRVFLNFYRVGQANYYLPSKMKFLGNAFDRVAIQMGLPGSIMAVRVEK